MMFKEYAKNAVGWKSKRKLVALAFDDYGSVRLDSWKARERLEQFGLRLTNRFDRLDALETAQDMSALLESLGSVRDSSGSTAVLTPYAVTGNINFRASLGKGKYVFSTVKESFERLAAKNPEAYGDARRIWKEGMEEGILSPEFHGREHLNVGVFNKLLEKNDSEVIECLKQNSYLSLPVHKKFQGGMSAAFAFEMMDETKEFLSIIKEGLYQFEEVYGKKATCFTPPAQHFPKHLIHYLPQLGIKGMDRPFMLNQHYGKGKYKRELHFTGMKNGLVNLVRNVVFEPTQVGALKAVALAMKQSTAAFSLKRPVIISSHRVNFGGHIEEKNRSEGLVALKTLLKSLIQQWPDIEFVSIQELEQEIRGT